MSRRKAFTLIEILVVTIIMGILAVIALPNYVNYIQQGQATAAERNLITIYNAEKNYYLYNKGVYCTSTTGTPNPSECSGSYCGDSLPDLNCNLATLDQLPTTGNPNPPTNLGITDPNFTYDCETNSAYGFYCTATNGTITLKLTNTQIILPGGIGSPNPSCLPDISNLCPNS